MKNSIHPEPDYLSNDIKRNKVDTIPTIAAVLVFLLAFCYAIASQGADGKHCSGTTKAGKECRQTMLIKGTDYCRLHQKNAVYCTHVNAKGKRCGMLVKHNETNCRFHK